MQVRAARSARPRTSPLVGVAYILTSRRFLRLAAPAYLCLMIGVWAVLVGMWVGGSGGRDRGGAVLGPDFPAFYTGGWLVRHGATAQLYDLDQQHALQRSLLPNAPLSAFVNPPHYAIVAIPLSVLPYSIAFGVWTLLMLLAFGVSLGLLRGVLPTLPTSSGWMLGLLALMFAPVYFAISAGQNTGLSLLLHVGILVALLRRRDTLAGSLIALGLFKPQLFVVLLPLVLLAGRWRVLWSFAISAAVLGMITLAWFGAETVTQWINLLRSPTYQFEEARQVAKMFSWQPVWHMLIGSDPLASVLGWASALLVFAGLCYLWWQQVGDLPLRYAITMCGIIVIGPHLPLYDLGLLLVPGLVLADRVLRMPPRTGLSLRVALLVLYVGCLFAIRVDLRTSVVIVPLITLLGVLAYRQRYALPSATAAQ